MSGDKSNRESQAKEFVEALVRVGEQLLAQRLGAAPDEAKATMQLVADAICMEYARRDIYVPMAYDPRNREIAAKYAQPSRSARAFSERRVLELAAEYGLTTRQIYSILRALRQAEFASRQGALPGFEAPPESPR